MTVIVAGIALLIAYSNAERERLRSERTLRSFQEALVAANPELGKGSGDMSVGGFLSHIFVYHGDATGAMRGLLFLIFFLVGFLEVISIMIRPISLTFRLFGNVYAGESLLETMLHLGGNLGFLAALPFYGLELMVGAIQALVFTLLTAVFTALMCKHDDGHAEEHGEAAHH